MNLATTNKVPNLVNCEDNSDRITVSGRALHNALSISSQYTKWINRMIQYGFSEGVDFEIIVDKKPTNNPRNPFSVFTDHQMSLNMAKEICMLQRTAEGRKYRQYFLELERKWNTPELIMARALNLASHKLEEMSKTVAALEVTTQKQAEQIQNMAPKAEYFDDVLQSEGCLPITVIAKDYGLSGLKMNQILHELGIQYRSGDTWVLYQKYCGLGYTKSKTTVIQDRTGKRAKTHTYWTQRGRKFLHQVMTENGYNPNIQYDQCNLFD